MNRKSTRWLGAVFMIIALPVSAQGPSSYEHLIQSGRAQLQAGDAEAARRTGEIAVHADPNRWEGYALEGGGLMNLKRYEDAADALSEAIEKAPDQKKLPLRELRRQCLASESGTTTAPTPATAATTTQAEVVLWKTIENSSRPDDFKAYLSQYPHGAFALLARQRLADAAAQERIRAEKAEAAGRIEAQRQSWTDVKAGLMWEKSNIDADTYGGEREVSYAEADDYCRNSHLLGLNDWRLPTLSELLPLGMMDDVFDAGNYWTSTASEDSDGHMAASFIDNYDNRSVDKISVADTTRHPGFLGRLGEMRVICVRAISPR